MEDFDLELKILSTMVYSPGGLQYYSELELDDFIDDYNRSVYAAIGLAGEIPDVKTLRAILEDEENDEYWSNFLNGSGTAYTLKDDIKKLKESGRKWRLYSTLNSSLKELDRHQAKPGICDEIISATAKGMEDCRDPEKRIQKLGDTGGDITRFKQNYRPTGIDALDEKIIGFRPTQFVVVAARPGIGKTTLVMQIAINMAGLNDKPVLFFTLEMELLELELKVLSNISEIDSLRIEHNILNADEYIKYENAQGKLHEINWEIHEEEDIHKIKSICEKSNPGLIVVDYIQLCQVKGIKDRHLQIGEITRTLKQLAKKMQCPVIGVSQLNRIAEGEIPTLSNLRESGTIEQDANTVIFIHGNTLIVAKNRGGRTGTVTVNYEKPIHKFLNNVHNINFNGEFI